MLLAALFVLAAPSVLLAVRDARAGRSSLASAARAVRANDASRARRDLNAAKQLLQSASHRLGSIWVLPVRLTPLLGRQVRAVKGVVDGSALMAEAGRASADVLDVQPPGGWAVRDGGLDLSSFGRAGKILKHALPRAELAKDVIDEAPNTWLIPPVHNLRSTAADTAGRVVDTMLRGAVGLEAAPRILGAGGKRRYLILNANLAELRGTGGLLGYFAVMDVDHGQLKLLPKTGRPIFDLPKLDPSKLEAPQWFKDAWDSYKSRETWLNVNMSTDFPEVGRLVARAVSSDPGPIDGVVQIDPYGLATLLSLTGPVNVAGWPVPVDTGNIARISQYEMYVRFNKITERDAFGKRLIGAVFAKMLSGDLPLNVAAVEKLGGATTAGHIKMWVGNAADEGALRTMGADGGYHDEPGFELGVFNLNVGQNKLDWFLHRTVRYHFVDDPATGGRALELAIELRNEAPLSGLPAYVTGPRASDNALGENETVLAILHPPGASIVDATVDGKPLVAISGREGELRLSQVRLGIPARRRIVFRARLVGEALRDVTSVRLIHQPIPQDSSSGDGKR